jgi:hypothetical protein
MCIFSDPMSVEEAGSVLASEVIFSKFLWVLFWQHREKSGQNSGDPVSICSAG